MEDSQLHDRWFQMAGKSFVRYITGEHTEDFESFMSYALGAPKGKSRAMKFRLIDSEFRTDETFQRMVAEVLCLKIKQDGGLSYDPTFKNVDVTVSAFFDKFISSDNNLNFLATSSRFIDLVEDRNKKLSLLRLFNYVRPNLIAVEKVEDNQIDESLIRMEAIANNVGKKKIKIKSVRVAKRGTDSKVFVKFQNEDHEMGLSPKQSEKLVQVLKALKNNDRYGLNFVEFDIVARALSPGKPTILRNEMVKEGDKSKFKSSERPFTIDEFRFLGPTQLFFHWNMTSSLQAKLIQDWDAEKI